MAWCTVDDANCPIIASTEGHSVGVPTVTERYNRSGEYIGYEEGEAFRTNIRSVPRCSLCFTVFEFPDATSREQYIDKKKALLVARHRGRRPAEPGLGLLTYGLLYILAVVIMVVAVNLIRNPVAELMVGLVAFGGPIALGVLISRGRKCRYNEEMEAWQTELNRLQSRGYCADDYQWLKNQ